MTWYDEELELDLIVTATVSGEYIRGDYYNPPEYPVVDEITRIVVDQRGPERVLYGGLRPGDDELAERILDNDSFVDAALQARGAGRD